MLATNPYLPPLAEVEPLPEEGLAVRKNELIGVLRDHSLPPICAACGATEGVQQFRKALGPKRRWTAGLLLVGLVAGWAFRQLLPATPLNVSFGVALFTLHVLIVTVVPRPRLLVPQCRRCGRRWRASLWWQSAVPYFNFAPAFAIWLGASSSLGVLLFFCLFGLHLVSLAGPRMVVIQVAKEDPQRIWLKGVHESAAAVYCGEIPDVDLRDLSAAWLVLS